MLSIFSEKKTPLGGFDYRIVTKLLGVPSYIDEISLFVRETAQNTWDARKDKNSCNDANYRFVLRAFTELQAATFAASVLNGKEDSRELTASLVQATSKGQPYIIIEDKGTVGLAGPTEDNVSSEVRNFVSFVRNIGQDKHDQNSGGAFGFGKSVFFRFSAVKTIITYTRTTNEQGETVSRIMGMSLFKETEEQTGRHWWGVDPSNHSKEFNQPLTGDSADKLATAIGFKAYGKNEMGTSVMMLSPSFPIQSTQGAALLSDPQGRLQFIQTIKEALLLWYWPRMLGSGKNDGRLVCTLSCDQSLDETISPDDLPSPIHLYQICFNEIQKTINNPSYKPDPQVTVKYIKKSSDGYGFLAVFKSGKSPRKKYETQAITPGHPFGSALWGSADGVASSRHVALIRAPGQVVKYEQMSESSMPANEYAAVFFLYPSGQNAKEIEAEVKKSEPHAHDDWGIQSNKTVLAIISRIRGDIQSIVAPNIATHSGNSDRMGKVALRLGGLWGEGDADGGNDDDDTGGGSGGGGGGQIKSEAALGTFRKEGCIFIKLLRTPTFPEGKKGIELSTKARTLGGGTIDLDSETGDPINNSGMLPGHIFGWFAGKPEDNGAELIAEGSQLPADKITREAVAKGIFAAVINAKTFGLKVTLKII